MCLGLLAVGLVLFKGALPLDPLARLFDQPPALLFDVIGLLVALLFLVHALGVIEAKSATTMQITNSIFFTLSIAICAA